MNSPRPLASSILVLAALAFSGCSDDSSTSDEPLQILVTNDDGFEAEGIDALVEGLVANSANEVVVCAPSGNRSGSGDEMGPSERCGNLDIASGTTLSGYPVTVIDGCPADAVEYALANLYPNGPPDVVLSGINEGQNISEPIATTTSGTVGAAKTAARAGLPALASSQGGSIGAVSPDSFYDFPAGVEASLGWLAENRSALAAGGQSASVTNLNIPSCELGTIRGTVQVPLAPTANNSLDGQDCESSLENPATDVEGLLNGFITLSPVPFD